MALVSYTKPILSDLALKQESVRKRYLQELKDPEEIYAFETVFGKELARRKIPFKRSIDLPKPSEDTKAVDRYAKERKKTMKMTEERIKQLRQLPSKKEQLKKEQALLKQMGISSRTLSRYERELNETGEIADFSQKRPLLFSTPSFIKSVLGIDQELKKPLFALRSQVNAERLLETLDEYIEDVLIRYQRYMKRKESFSSLIQQGFDMSSLTEDWDIIESENSRLISELERYGVVWNYKLSKTDIRRENIEEIIQHLTAFRAELTVYNLIQFYLDLWNKKYEQIHTLYSDTQFRYINIDKQPYPDVSLLSTHYKNVDKHLSQTRELREIIEKDLKNTRESTIAILEESVDKNMAKIKNLFRVLFIGNYPILVTPGEFITQ